MVEIKTIIIYSDELKNYDFGEGHPFSSDRFERFLELFKEKLGKDKRFELIENITLVAAISGGKINFKESVPDIRDRRITETRNLIKKAKEKSAP